MGSVVAQAESVAGTDVSAVLAGKAAAPDKAMTLWYRAPAEKWVEAIPIGNGRLAAMVFGGTENERLQLNEDTLYSGGPYDPSNPEALETLPKVRQLIFDGKYRDADALIGEKMMARPLRQMPYQPVGDVLLGFPGHNDVSDYRRELDLDTAIARVTYTVDGVRFMREIFSSAVDQVIVIRLTADTPGSISFTATMSSPQNSTVESVAPDTLVMRGVNGEAQGIEGKLKFQARVRVLAEGSETTVGGESVAVNGADSATLFIAAATSYNSYDDVSGDPEARAQRDIANAAGKTFEQVRADHVAEYQNMFRRVELDVGTSLSLIHISEPTRPY